MWCFDGTDHFRTVLGDHSISNQRRSSELQQPMLLSLLQLTEAFLFIRRHFFSITTLTRILQSVDLPLCDKLHEYDPICT